MFMERKHWTPKEDEILISLVEQIGKNNWALVSLRLSYHCPQICRSGKQCRQRWSNYLNKKIQNNPWDDEEQYRLFQLHKIHGNKWKQIANQLGNRVDGEVKNHLYATFRRGIRRMNKFVGMKMDPSTIRVIKPSVMTNTFNREQSNVDLILKFSKAKLLDRDIEKLLENSSIKNQIIAILNQLVCANEIRERDKKKGKRIMRQQSQQPKELYSEDLGMFLNLSSEDHMPKFYSDKQISMNDSSNESMDFTFSDPS